MKGGMWVHRLGAKRLHWLTGLDGHGACGVSLGDLYDEELLDKVQDTCCPKCLKLWREWAASRVEVDDEMDN